MRIDCRVSSLRDIDSLVKPILDCVEKSGVIENDRQVMGLVVTKRPKRRRRDLDRIRVLVSELGKR